ncbi:hypothetical protein D3C81_1361910 [compost metagenome]
MPQASVGIGRTKRLVEDDHRVRAVKHQITGMDYPRPACIGTQRTQQIGVHFVAVEFGHVQRQRELGRERAGGSVVGQRNAEATFADGHPHIGFPWLGGCFCGILGNRFSGFGLTSLASSQHQHAEYQAQPTHVPRHR